MSYNLECLGDERFQKLCQGLLISDFPNARALATGQPDGGRDAFIRGSDGSNEVVFQVKYSKNPLAKDARDELIALYKLEKDKIELLKSEGLKSYYLITNISGTSHKEVGSVDVLDKLLSELTGVTAHCWWREDIESRLDSSILRWSYPEILSGADALGILMRSDLGDSWRRRKNAISAYLAYYYDAERDLKFKQVDLENNIFNLFTDLFVYLKPSSSSGALSTDGERLNRGLASTVATELMESGLTVSLSDRHNHRVSASALLTLRSVSNSYRNIVLEGGPGQGKSTISQFMCQIFRARLIGKSDDLSGLHSQYKSGAIKLPLKVDLRDYAIWVKANIQPDDSSAKHSFERYIAYTIETHSGGIPFDVSDLHEILRDSSTLLVLDGFDEVADVALRSTIIEQATSSAQRFGGMSLDYQIVVTSRPTAFVNAPSFEEAIWQHVDLNSLEAQQVEEYLARWIRAKDIKGVERDNFSNRVLQRVQEEHIAELARNPMQLAILLSLMWSMGESLPDKRTALYRSYVELFLNREAEKDVVVRDYREEVLELHGHIAWLLQCKVETEGSDGRLTEGELLYAVKGYLKAEQYDDTIAGKLFKAMRQRVVAIVSRVEGTYEFEVQPLREFFAGTHLYKTSPYSPTGSEKSGTRGDRFKALSRNVYWGNVTRFFSGCYDKGELPGLRESLEELFATPGYGLTSEPTHLCLTLLSDWVFSQSMPSKNALLGIICDEDRFRVLLSRIYTASSRLTLSLPERQGRSDLTAAALAGLNKSKTWDSRYAYASILKANLSADERVALWNTELGGLSPEDRASAGHALDVFLDKRLPFETVKHQISNRYLDLSDVYGDESYLADLVDDSDIYSLSLNAMLNGTEESFFFDTPTTARQMILMALAAMSGSEIIGGLSHRAAGRPLVAYLSVPLMSSRPNLPGTNTLAPEVAEWIDATLGYLFSAKEDWLKNASPWQGVINLGVGVWGDRLLFYRLAIAACALGTEEMRSAFAMQHAGPLKWAADAFSEKNSVEFWTSALAASGTSRWVGDCVLFVLMASEHATLAVLPVFDEAVSGCDESDFKAIITLVKEIGRIIEVEPRAIDFSTLNASTVAVYASVPDGAERGRAFASGLRHYAGLDQNIHGIRSAFALDEDQELTDDERLAILRDAYTVGASSYSTALSRASEGALTLGYSLCLRILREPGLYPIFVVNAANQRVIAAHEPEGVSERARVEHWFPEMVPSRV